MIEPLKKIFAIPPKQHDPEKLALALQKRAAEKALRADGYSRTRAAAIAAATHRKK